MANTGKNVSCLGVAGNANRVSCPDRQHTKGVSFHTFPNKARNSSAVGKVCVKA